MPSSLPDTIIYVMYFAEFTVVTLLAGILALMVFPVHYRKVAIVWSIIGLIEVILSGLIFYPYNIFEFHGVVAVGLLTLTCGAILITFSILKAQNPRILSGGILFVGCLELTVFLDFYSKYPDTSRWNFMYITLPYGAFLIFSFVTLVCGVLALWKPKFSSRTKKE